MHVDGARYRCLQLFHELCHIWMSRHVTYEWVVMTCRIWISHVLSVILHMNESCLVSCVTYQWVMTHTHEACHIWMRHVLWAMPHLNELSWIVTYEWVMSCELCHTWMSQVTYQRPMSRAYQRGMSYQSYHITISCVSWVVSLMNESGIWISHVTYECVTHMNKACVMSSFAYESVTHMNKSCHV